VTGTLADIQATTRRILAAHLPAGAPVALLDAPSYENAGDGLIWLGQRQYLRGLGIPLSYTASQGSFSEAGLRRRLPVGPLLISGGGNLGDRWLEHQDFRERVVRTFPDRPIIQLSQSIEFRDPRRAASARALFETHPDLTLLMRDQVSLATAREIFPRTRVEFCPDMAYGVGQLGRRGDPEVDLLLLLRRDSEAVPRHFAVPHELSHVAVDWSMPIRGRAAWRILRQPEAFVRDRERLRGPGYHLLRASGQGMVASAVHFARRTLARGRVVVTDRLHAMVLASLSGIPVVALDNSYGKISALHRDYAGLLPLTHFAHSADEALDVARSLLDKVDDNSPDRSARTRT
jgi:pyruvyl transferase EpsO